jgi:hypothetical protein
MVIGVYSAKYVTTPVLRGNSSSVNSRPMSDIQDRRSEFKELCNIPTSNMKLSFGMTAVAVAKKVHDFAKAQQSTFSKIGQSVESPVIVDLKKLPSLTHKAERKGIETFKQARVEIRDANRSTIITDGSSKGVSAAIKQLLTDIKSQGGKILAVKNNFAPGSSPYLSKKDINALKAFNRKEWNEPIKIKPPVNWGYPAAKIELEFPGKGKIINEVQITGKNCHKEDKMTHLLHKMRQKRFVPTNELEQQAYDDHYKLSVKGKKRLYAHYADRYAHNRNLEQGIESVEPVYPQNLPESLNPENLKRMATIREYNQLTQSLQVKTIPVAY